MMSRNPATTIASLALATILALQAGQAAGQEPQYVRVLVALKGNWRYEGDLRSEDIKAQRAAIAATQARVITGIRAESGQPNRAASARLRRVYATVPGIALELRQELVSRLEQLPDVALVYEDRLYAPFLGDPTNGAGTTNIVGSRLLNDSQIGVDGSGQVVAIIDTGVDRDHPFLGTNRFVANACFSETSWFNADRVTLCPNGQDEQIGGDSGENCTGITGCDHGTHVAGIAGGYTDSDGNGRMDRNDRKGVAPRIKFVTMQVFHRVNSNDICDSNGGGTATCLRTSSSDYIAALDRVELLRDDHAIASANLSLGGGAFPSHCDFLVLEKWAIDNLRSRKTATVIAAGNDNEMAAMAAPACVSSAISVGNTRDDDVINSASNGGSNTSSTTDLLAPGTSVLSSVSGTGFGNKTGTSMAAPHVAGIWALMKQDLAARGEPTTVSAIHERLRNTGKSVTRAGITIPRVDAIAALGRKIVEITAASSSQIDRGAQAILPVQLNRRNFGGAVDMTGSIIGGNPSHISVSFSADPVWYATVNMGLSVSLSAGGNYALNVTGAADGVTVFGAQLPITVTEPARQVMSLVLDRNEVVGGTPVAATATLNGPTPFNGFTAWFTNSAPLATTLASSFPIAFTQVQGQAFGTASFQIGTRPVHSDTNVTIGTGDISRNFVVRSPRVQSLAIAPSVVTPGTVATATATLTGPAPASGGTPQTGMQVTTITTSSAATSVAAVGGSALVTPATSAATFAVTAQSVPSAACARITASRGDAASAYIGVAPSQIPTIALGPQVVTAPMFQPVTITVQNLDALTRTISIDASRSGFTVSPRSVTLSALRTASITVTPSTDGCAMITASAQGAQRSIMIVAYLPPQG